MPKRRQQVIQKKVKYKIDEETLEKLCRLHCSIDEIANFFNTSKASIERFVREKYNMNFSDFWRWKAAEGKVALKMAQYREALAGNTTLLVYLGKVLLGQREGLGDVRIEFELVLPNNQNSNENNQTESDNNLLTDKK